MYKIISTVLFLIVMVISVDTRAADNLKLTSYDAASKLPAKFFDLGGGSELASEKYKDDDGNVRTDKTYYTASHSYKSTYKLKEISKILNPASGRLGTLFEETTVSTKSAKEALFNVQMTISTPLKDFDCESILKYQTYKKNEKDVFLFSFSGFNMVFTRMIIKVELKEIGSMTEVRLSQVSAIKGSTITKLNTYWVLGKFEKALKANLQKLKSGIGGI